MHLFDSQANIINFDDMKLMMTLFTLIMLCPIQILFIVIIYIYIIKFTCNGFCNSFDLQTINVYTNKNGNF